MKPATGGEATGKAPTGPSGVVGDSARGKISRGAWEARSGGQRRSTPRREDITLGRPGRESERPIVAQKRGNARGAKGPYWKQDSVRRGEPVFALVRRLVSRSARAGSKGRCQAGALRR